jgi:hypothetical protein
MNCVLSSLLTEEREIEGLKRQKKKNDVVYIYIYIFFVNWSYFIMSLLYWGPILEAFKFLWKKKIWALFKKEKKNMPY